MFTRAIIIILLICHVIDGQYERSALEIFTPQYRIIRNIALNIFGKSSENSMYMRRARAANRVQSQIPLSVPFPCNVTGFRSKTPPKSVHQLRPGDIDVIGALGDSLTAGNGLVATTLLQVLVENRGLSFSIGGQGTWREYLTLPNILKEFNPNLMGYSLGDSYSTDKKSQFNPAEGAAVSSELPHMAEVLIKRIKNDPRVDLENHWKLITILIGANDFCFNICLQNDPDSILLPHQNDLLKVLRTLRDNLPRTLINLVPPPDVTIMKDLGPRPQQCGLLNWVECYCVLNLQYRNKINTYQETIKKWQKLDEKIGNLKEFQRDDFAVVVQPFFLQVHIPVDANNKTDFTFLSQDCFHLSQRSFANIVNSFWNNMMQKVGNKSENVPDKLFDTFLCPTEEHPFIYTNLNSKNN